MDYDVHLIRPDEIDPDGCFADVVEHPEDYALMQFTGLHDKNGKEIYEGDLLKTRQGTTVVYWKDASFKTNHINTIRTLSHLMTKYQVEIIGNIYSNPELINTPNQ